MIRICLWIVMTLLAESIAMLAPLAREPMAVMIFFVCGLLMTAFSVLLVFASWLKYEYEQQLMLQDSYHAPPP